MLESDQSLCAWLFDSNNDWKDKLLKDTCMLMTRRMQASVLKHSDHGFRSLNTDEDIQRKATGANLQMYKDELGIQV